MGRAEESTTGCFVHTTGFDPDETIFDNVDTAYGVGTSNFVGVREEFKGVSLLGFMLSDCDDDDDMMSIAIFLSNRN